jgi:hypothetical protein
MPIRTMKNPRIRNRAFVKSAPSADLSFDRTGIFGGGRKIEDRVIARGGRQSGGKCSIKSGVVDSDRESGGSRRNCAGASVCARPRTAARRSEGGGGQSRKLNRPRGWRNNSFQFSERLHRYTGFFREHMQKNSILRAILHSLLNTSHNRMLRQFSLFFPKFFRKIPLVSFSTILKSNFQKDTKKALDFTTEFERYRAVVLENVGSSITFLSLPFAE